MDFNYKVNNILRDNTPNIIKYSIDKPQNNHINTLYKIHSSAIIKNEKWGSTNISFEDRKNSATQKLYFLLKNKTLNDWIGENSTFLDIGCGDGSMGETICETYKLKKRIVYNDLEYNIHKDLKLSDNKTFHKGDLDSLEGTFDLITCFHVFHHIENNKSIKKKLENIYRLLSPNGLFIFREHDSNGKDMKFCIELTHICYEVSEIEKMKYNDFKDWLNNYSLNLKSKTDWYNIIKSVGFKSMKVINFKNKLNTYFQIFTK